MAQPPRSGEEVPTYAFPLEGPLPGELALPPGYGPLRRWWWRRGLRRSEVAQMTGPLTRMLNLWFEETLAAGGQGFRIVSQLRPEDAETRLEEAQEQYQAHVLEARRAMMDYMPSWQYMMQQDPRTTRMWLQSASGDWTQKHDLFDLFAQDLIDGIMSLAPHGTCRLTREGDQPPLLVTMKRLAGDLQGLEVSWVEQGPAMG